MTYPLAAAPDAPELTVVSYDHDDARRLTRALQAEQIRIYGFADDPEDTAPGDFTPPHGQFLIARDPHGDAIACGGWRSIPTLPDTAEIKRMYVTPVARGDGLGRQVLQRLEREAAHHGVRRMLLETGARNTAALALYNRCGYSPRTPYVDGRNTTINRAMSKQLQLMHGHGASSVPSPAC